MPPAATASPDVPTQTPAGPAPAVDDRALCLGCHYPLRGLPTNRCPECGRTFDPSDPWTMNVGRPMPAWLRWLAQPAGRPTHVASLVAVAGIWWGMGWLPGGLWVVTAAVVLILLAYVWRTVRCLARHLAVIRYRQPRELFRAHSTFHFLPSLALGITLILVALDVPLRATVAVNHQLVAGRLHRAWADDPMPTGVLGPQRVGMFPANGVRVTPSGVLIDTRWGGRLYFLPDGDTGLVDYRYQLHLWGPWYADRTLRGNVVHGTKGW